MAEYDAGQSLDLEIMHAVALLLRKVAHLRLGKFDILEVALRHLRDGVLDLLRAEAEILRRPVVEFLRQVGHRRILTRVDIGEDALHRFAHLGVGGLDCARVHSALEPTSHDVFLLFQSCHARLCGHDSRGGYFIACGLIGEPVPPVMISGGPQKKNS